MRWLARAPPSAPASEGCRPRDFASPAAITALYCATLTSANVRAMARGPNARRATITRVNAFHRSAAVVRSAAGTAARASAGTVSGAVVVGVSPVQPASPAPNVTDVARVRKTIEAAGVRMTVS